MAHQMAHTNPSVSATFSKNVTQCHSWSPHIQVPAVASLKRVRVSPYRRMIYWRPFNVYILKHWMIYLIYKVTKVSHISILSPENLSMNWIMHQVIKTYTAMEVQRHTLLISAVHRSVRLASRSVPLPPRKKFLVPTGKEARWTPEPVWKPQRREEFILFIHEVESRRFGRPAIYWPRSPCNRSQLRRKNNGWRQCWEPRNWGRLATHHSCRQQPLAWPGLYSLWDSMRTGAGHKPYLAYGMIFWGQNVINSRQEDFNTKRTQSREPRRSFVIITLHNVMTEPGTVQLVCWLG